MATRRVRHNDHFHDIELLDEDGDEIATVDGRYVREGYLARRFDGTLVACLPRCSQGQRAWKTHVPIARDEEGL